MTLQICVAQLNYVVGDMDGNAQKIIDLARLAHGRGVRLILTPELALCGYAAEDLFLRPSFIAACDDALSRIARELADLKDLAVVVGHPVGDGRRSRSVSVPRRHNRASVLRAGQVIASYDKRELPNYQVFDERRYFQPGSHATVFEHAGVRIGLLICEDAWFEQPAADCRALGAELLAVINASPFHVGKGNERELAMAERCRQNQLPLIYAHLVGGQDEVVFEGRSFALDAQGQVSARASSFAEAAFDLTFSPGQGGPTGDVSPETSLESDLWHALVLGVRDYLGKNGFPGALLGLSGGIDSALVLAIAVDALGADRVRAVMMPSPYTADISWIDARDMAARLHVRYDEISIVPEFEAFLASLATEFHGLPLDTTEENIQARIRGTLLMALSNKFGSIVLTTGNKSEMAVGYATLYGDMAGGFAVIKDILKTFVYRLCTYRNSLGRVIPENILTRAPSAELKPDQKDQDSLPPYEVLDAIIEAYMERNESPAAIVAAGYPEHDVRRVIGMLRRNEYKRRQSPVGIRVTQRGFGRDWRNPITNRYTDRF